MFFGLESNILFEEFGIWHFIPMITIVLGTLFIFVFRKQIRESKYEQYYRYALGGFGILMEISLHLWKVGNGVWKFPVDLPIGLCAFSLIMGIYVMFTKSWKVFEIAYFWSLGGVVSVLFPDILYGPDNFRYYQFLLAHMVFFWMFMYMLFVHQYIPTKESFKKSFLLLLGIVLFFIIPINFLLDANFMYLKEPGDTPFIIFEGHGYFLYAAGSIGLSMIIITLWYSPIYFYTKLKKEE